MLRIGGSRLARFRGRPLTSVDERRTLRRLRRYGVHRQAGPGRVRLFGADLEFADGRAFFAQYKEIFVRGIYDFHVSTRTPRILDCGGHVGLAALRFRALYPRADILSLEPDPELVALLRSNLEACEDTRTEIIAAAVWSEGGHVRFRQDGRDTGRVDDRGSLEISAVDVAQMCEGPISLLKLDVEGAERVVLRRLVESGAADRVERIACEWHDAGREDSLLHRTLGMLADAGFAYRVFAGGASAELDSDPTLSGLARVPYNGATAMLYAWRSR